MNVWNVVIPRNGAIENSENYNATKLDSDLRVNYEINAILGQGMYHN